MGPAEGTTYAASPCPLSGVADCPHLHSVIYPIHNNTNADAIQLLTSSHILSVHSSIPDFANCLHYPILASTL